MPNPTKWNYRTYWKIATGCFVPIGSHSGPPTYSAAHTDRQADRLIDSDTIHTCTLAYQINKCKVIFENVTRKQL